MWWINLISFLASSSWEWNSRNQVLLKWSEGLFTLYTLTSACIFSILLFIHFLRCWQGEFVHQSKASKKASLVGDHFLYSHDLNVWSRVILYGEIDVSHSDLWFQIYSSLFNLYKYNYIISISSYKKVWCRALNSDLISPPLPNPA